jgi:ABC-2 type transport system ATP-binding protein
MKQRLGLAAALVCDAGLLILDEPTSALDPAGRSEVLDLVTRLGRTTTVIFSSHILADVQRVAATIGVLRDGRLLYQGATRELLDSYTSPAWELRVRGATGTLPARLRAQDWVTSADVDEAAGVITVHTTTTAAGETGLPKVIAASGAALLSMNPVGADLESAFLALTQDKSR